MRSLNASYNISRTPTLPSNRREQRTPLLLNGDSPHDCEFGEARRSGSPRSIRPFDAGRPNAVRDGVCGFGGCGCFLVVWDTPNLSNRRFSELLKHALTADSVSQSSRRSDSVRIAYVVQP